MRFIWLLTILSTLIGIASGLAEPVAPLPNGTTVRVQSPEMIPGWHIGKLEITPNGCTMIWISSSEVPGGRRGFGLMFLSKLERQEGPTWVDVRIAPLMKKEPELCRHGAG
jgi:hypothetical protein